MKPFRKRPAGTTFVEALITFLVLSLGLLAVSRVQGQLRLTGEVARQRSEAVRLAQEDLEQLRSFASVLPSPTRQSYANVVSTTRTIDSGSGYASNTRYALSRQVAAADVAAAKSVSVTVSWADRAGDTQKVTLATVIAASDPSMSGALGLAPLAAPVNGAMARAPGIPPGASNLGDGRSAYRPGDRGDVAFVFDNGSGVINERCRVDLTGCVRTTAYLLGGVVRFTSSTDTAERPLPAVVSLNLNGGVYPAAPECSTDVVVSAEDRYLAYACIVYPRADGQWSGQSRIVPDGWTLGNGPADRRVCPYLPAGHGSPPPEADRLARYVDATGGLVNQNFRVIRGDVSCAT